MTHGGSSRTLHATCTKCGDARGFTNLRVTRRDDEIEFDPHVTGACVVRLSEDAARVLFGMLREWLG